MAIHASTEGAAQESSRRGQTQPLDISGIAGEKELAIPAATADATISAEAGCAPAAAKEPVKVYRLVGGDRR